MSVPIVPLSSFSNLAGPALAEDLLRLASNPELAGIVLFSDTLGEQLALLPVGAGQRYDCAEDVAGEEIEGLRPLCALELNVASSKAKGQSARAQELARMDESLKARERYIAECEHRLAEVGQNLAEREAMLEQREQLLLTKERDFFRRSGEVTRRAQEGAARASDAAHG